MYESILTDDFRSKLNTPQIVLGIIDKSRASNFLIIESIPNVRMVSWIYEGYVNFSDTPKPPPGLSSNHVVIKAIAEQLAVIHSEYWCDMDKLKVCKNEIKRADYLLGEGREKFEENALLC